MTRRHQCVHGTNPSGAARSPLGCIVWATDWSSIVDKKPPLRTEDEEVECAMRRAGITEAPPKKRGKRGGRGCGRTKS